jgi:hypothetical protein
MERIRKEVGETGDSEPVLWFNRHILHKRKLRHRERRVNLPEARKRPEAGFSNAQNSKGLFLLEYCPHYNQFPLSSTQAFPLPSPASHSFIHLFIQQHSQLLAPFLSLFPGGAPFNFC